jgi:hypothetical protein
VIFFSFYGVIMSHRFVKLTWVDFGFFYNPFICLRSFFLGPFILNNFLSRLYSTGCVLVKWTLDHSIVFTLFLFKLFFISIYFFHIRCWVMILVIFFTFLHMRLARVTSWSSLHGWTHLFSWYFIYWFNFDLFFKSF